MKRVLQVVMICLSACFFLLEAQAQIFHPQAGSSTLMGAHGGSVGFEAPGYTGAFGAGYVDGHFELGGVVRTKFKGYEIFAGDDTLRFNFPTDVFDSSYFFIGRGIGLAKSSDRGFFKTFAGTSSEYVGANFFQAARNGTPLFAGFGEYKLSSQLSLTSSLILGDKQTLISGMAFRPKAGTLFALSAGMGGNAPYFASAVKLERRRYDFKASYVATDLSFRRTNARTSVVSESDRDNEELTWRINERASLTLGRQNLLAPVSVKDVNGSRATVHQVAGSYLIQKFQLSGGFFQSKVQNGTNLGESFRVFRPVTSKIDLGLDYYRNSFQGTTNSSWSTNVREKFSRRVSLIQYVNRSAGQTSYSFGGELSTKRLTIGVSNDTTYVPFRAQSAGGPFLRTYNIRISLRPFRTFSLDAYTNVDPAGKLRYTTYAGDYLYRYEGLQGGTMYGARSPVSIPKYVIKGRVLDALGKPVAGAAIQIDGELVFTNSEGEFVARFRKKQATRIHVSLRDFLTNEFYDVVHAPTEATPQEEDKATDIVIELRRVDRATGMRLMAAEDGQDNPGSNPPAPAANSAFIPQR
jgi:hypothetical protein